jgi:hypothetical protein
MDADALLALGEKFLTFAFHRFGALAMSNRVAAIERAEPCPGGSTGAKLFLSLRYEQPDASLDTELFVKFSRDLSDDLRDRQRWEMEGEVRLSALSRHPNFPVSVPTTYFADFEAKSGSGLIITSRVAFGQDGIEPQRVKCMDHELADPLAYYRALVVSLARLAGAHKAGQLSPELEAAFPFDRAACVAREAIPFTAEELLAQIARFCELADLAPQLFPAEVIEPEFIARFTAQALSFLENQEAVWRFLHADADYIALCHWNANIDNAWFWRDEAGALNCGLIDWGGVGQLNVVYALWGCLLAAPRNLWDNDLGSLLWLFSEELSRCGGPRLTVGGLRLHLDLYVAVIGLAKAIVAPDRILFRLPDAMHATGPRDPIFDKSPPARNFLHVFTNFINLWRRHDFGRSLDAMLARSGEGQ